MKLKIINLCEKKIKKESMDFQRNFIQSITELGRKIISKYEINGENFNNIFNDNSIKYDKHGNDFWVYKSHGKNNSQMRILYSCIQDSEYTYIFVIDYMEKRKGNMGRCVKDHIQKFSKYNTMKLEELYNISNLKINKRKEN